MAIQYDLIILGSGPAGLTAAIYASRYNLNFLVIGRDGGMIAETSTVCNYPGFEEIDGLGLIDKFTQHAEKLGAKIIYDEVKSLETEKEIFLVKTASNHYKTKTVIYALGGSKRKLGIDTEQKFVGKGVSYCATCDAAFYKNKTVVVAGGANSAVSTVLLLSEIADKVYLVYRREQLRALPSLVEQIKKKPKVEILYETTIKEIKGKNFVGSVVLESRGKIREIKAEGIFVEFGYEPNFELAEKIRVELNKDTRIKIKPDTSTNLTGFFAAGDITDGSNQFDQVITAAAEGAIAAASAYRYVKTKRG